MSESNNTQQNGDGVVAKASMVVKDAVNDVTAAVTGEKRPREEGEAVISKPDELNDEQKKLAEDDAKAEKEEKETGQQQDGVPVRQSVCV